MYQPYGYMASLDGCFGGSVLSALMRIQSAFEKAGIRFIDNDAAGGIGVRFHYMGFFGC